MYFRKISIHGFKSFADPITIEFDRGITCVVGPNGSGKSNIFDALRWVLGEQSPKTLRGGKMDEVIFAGTASRKSRGMAEVSLLIDNSDASLPVDFSEVEITRRMYRSGESEYYINRSQCRLRDIRELVMDTGIGVDGYSFIGQGKIAEIVSGRADSRREIFEEAAGIVKYRSKKAEAEKKLLTADRNLDRVNDIIADLETRIGPLKAEAERAEEYLQLSREYAETETGIIVRSIAAIGEASESLKNQIDDTERQIAEVRREKEAVSARIADLAAQASVLDQEDLAERDRMMEFAGRLSELRNTKKYVGERILTLQERIQALGEEQKALNFRLEEEQESRQASAEKADALQRKLTAVQQMLHQKNELFLQDSRNLKESENRAEDGRNRLYDLGIGISSISAEISGMRNLRDSLQDRYERLKQSVGASGDEDGEESQNEEERHILHTEGMLQDTEARIKELKGDAEQCAGRLFSLSQELQKTVMELSRKEAERNALLHMENTYEGYGGAVRFLMKEAKIDGIFGTVGELIEVPSGYEIAVETALGARMQNIICRDDTSADQAVRLLKQKKAGRLTFLPVSSLRVSPRRYEEELFREKGFLAAASQCVTTLPPYVRAVEYLLSGVVIVDTLDSASRIAARYRGCRCVTLEGEIVSPAGAITGGSYRKNTGGILDRKKRLAEIEEEIRLHSAEKTHQEHLTESLRDEISKIEKLLKEQEREEARLKLQLMREKDEQKARDDFRNERRTRRQRTQQEMQRLRREIEEAERRIEEMEAEEARCNEEIKALRDAVERQLTENEILRKSLESLGNGITEMKLKAESLRGEFAAADAAVQRSAKEILRLTGEVQEKASSKESIAGEIAQRQKEWDEAERMLFSMESSDESGGGRLEEIKNRKAQNVRHTAEQNEIRQKKERTLYELESVRREMNLRLNGNEEQTARLKDRLWEEFQISYPEAVKHCPLSSESGAQAERRSKSLRRRLRELGEVNTGAAAEYEAVRERYEFMDAQRSDLTEAADSLGRIIRETDKKIRSDFQNTFQLIQTHFKTVFSELFGGGTAQLSVRGDDMLEAEIDIIAQPPGKKLQNMNLLSGGEKTMTAIALMFAVLKAKPAPFCILDEVEAALDEANIERFSAYLENFRGVQFVLVTHQKVTMEHADALYGVTMPEKGISKVLSLKLSDAKQIGDNVL